MKKILFILPALSVGGLERVQVNLANALAERGHNVTILILDNIRNLENELDDSVKLVYKPYRRTWFSKLPYIRSKFYADGMWETRVSPKKLHDYYVGEEKFDVEIAFFRGMSIKIVSGCADKNVKKLAWVHNDFSKAYGYKNNFRSLSDVKKAYESFDKVVCVSNQAKDGFIQVIGDTDNLTTIYNLTPVKKVKKLSNAQVGVYDKSKFNVVVVARLLDCAKGQIRLINAVSKIKNLGIDIFLTIVGDGPDRAKIEGCIQDLNAKEYVQLTGMQQNPYPYVSQADLLVCSSFYEGYNLTVAEALILGTPVLSTRCAGPIEILDNGKYGLLVENSEEGIKEGLLKILSDRELYKHYREMAIKRSPFFSEDRILDEIEKLL